MHTLKLLNESMDVKSVVYNELKTFKEMIANENINSYAQPIIDLYSGKIIGFELLARGHGEFFSPDKMFKKAKEFGLSWELEYACRNAALKKIKIISKNFPYADFFINVSPDVFTSTRFQSGFTLNTLKTLGVDPRSIILEITETTTVKDYSHFEEMIRHYVKQGFRIALDDFGSGHSGLTTLIATTPHIMKVDKDIVKGIDKNNYKQNLVRSMSEFAGTVGSSILLEGIETIEELKTAYRLGARYAQGFLFAKPQNIPRPLSKELNSTITSLIKKYSKKTSAVEITIFSMISRPPVFKEKSLLGSELDEFFRAHNAITHVVITDNKNKPTGLITKQHFYSHLSGRYGFSIFQNKTIEKVAKKTMLIVKEDTDLRILGKLTMSRPNEDIYDPVIVVDDNKSFIGTITMKTVISRAFDTEIKFATSANPLTTLPGNVIINVWLEEFLKKDNYSIAYFDLDRFKEYNDNYGFSNGDKMIQFLSNLLGEHVESQKGEFRLGHIGGDDFVIVSDKIIDQSFLDLICKDFDIKKAPLFSKQDIENCSYICKNRKGETEKVPLVTLSIAVITSNNFLWPVHSGKLSQCISLLKNKIKETNMKNGRSGFMIERRIYDEL